MKKDLIDKLLSEMNELDVESYNAMAELINNIEIVESLLARIQLTQDELENFIKIAREKQSHFIYFLLLYKKYIVCKSKYIKH